MAKKLKVVWWSNSPLARTGLGRNTKSVLNYLYETDKYDICMYSMNQMDGNPEFDKLPYKVMGSIPQDQNAINHINSHRELEQLVGYGGYNLDAMVKSEKPDVLILSDDFWAGTHTNYWEKPWFNKFHCVAHITLDSVPVLPDAIKYADKIKHYFVWADFAQKILNDLGHGHVQTITGAIDPKPFYKLSFAEKRDLRERFEIPQDSFITMMTSRNQLRKEFIILMEGFAQFKKENPNAKAKLLLHTHVPENNGWDLPRAAEELKIVDDVLYTYICKVCNEIDVKNYKGQDIDCKFCKGKNTAVTCNIVLGCSENDLNKVYNLADCYCHPANAAGLELGLIEAAYVELPIATCDYSGTTMFTKHEGCYKIDFSWGRQVGTNFKRSIPYANSISKFISKIYNLPLTKRQELGRSIRKYALETFTPTIVGKQWENFLDTLPPADYNYEFGEAKKNDTYPFREDISDDTEWVSDLYKNILQSTPDEDGLKNWLGGLKHGQTRKQVYDFFINVAKEHNGKNQEQDVSLDELFPRIDNKKNVLLVLPQSLGDHVIFTGLLPEVYKKYPLENHTIYLAAEHKFFEVHEGNNNIKLVPFHPIMRQEIIMMGAGGTGPIDYFIDVAAGAQIHLNYLTNKY